MRSGCPGPPRPEDSSTSTKPLDVAGLLAAGCQRPHVRCTTVLSGLALKFMQPTQVPVVKTTAAAVAAVMPARWHLLGQKARRCGAATDHTAAAKQQRHPSSLRIACACPDIESAHLHHAQVVAGMGSGTRRLRRCANAAHVHRAVGGVMVAGAGPREHAGPVRARVPMGQVPGHACTATQPRPRRSTPVYGTLHPLSVTWHRGHGHTIASLCVHLASSACVHTCPKREPSAVQECHLLARRLCACAAGP